MVSFFTSCVTVCFFLVSSSACFSAASARASTSCTPRARRPVSHFPHTALALRVAAPSQPQARACLKEGLESHGVLLQDELAPPQCLLLHACLLLQLRRGGPVRGAARCGAAAAATDLADLVALGVERHLHKKHLPLLGDKVGHRLPLVAALAGHGCRRGRHQPLRAVGLLAARPLTPLRRRGQVPRPDGAAHLRRLRGLLPDPFLGLLLPLLWPRPASNRHRRRRRDRAAAARTCAFRSFSSSRMRNTSSSLGSLNGLRGGLPARAAPDPERAP